MNKRSKIWISSSTYGKAFIAKAWEARGELLEYERHGFAQFFYLTLCGHLESVLVNRIKARLKLIELSQWEKLGPIECTIKEEKHLCPIDPVVASIRHIASKITSKIEIAPLAKLIQFYADVFSENINIEQKQSLLLQ